VADRTAFFSLDESRIGTLIEYDDTAKLFSNPEDSRTRAYITGQFG
jgi:phosphate transport system ATP-binding protein